MDRKKFFERYSPMFGTSSFNDTYEAWLSLPEEERKQLKSKAISEGNINSLQKYPDRYKNLSEKLRGRTKTTEQKAKPLKSKVKKESAISKKAPKVPVRVLPKVKKTVFVPTILPKDVSLNEKCESELQAFVKSILPEAQINASSIVKDVTFSVYSDKFKVAIMVHDNYKKSEACIEPPGTFNQLKITELCEKENIRLIHIFSDEWLLQQPIVKSLISSAFGVYNRRFFARKLKFRELDRQTGNQFLNENHIQGSVPAEKFYGLFTDSNELMQVISIGHNRFTKDKNTELIRMATKINCQVVGGFSKLIKDAGITEIESYVDRRLFDSKGYKASGWELVSSSLPRYFYTDGVNRENRQRYMKQTCLKKWPEFIGSNMTEYQMCTAKNLFRIYDCGTFKYKYTAKV